MEHREGEVEAEVGRAKIARIQSNHVQNGSLIRQAGYAQRDYSPGDLLGLFIRGVWFTALVYGGSLIVR